jgi:1,4-dihydroxy-2-naphthoate octaprenyltransferase
VLVGASLPRANRVLRAFRAAPPTEPPPGYPLWPLWYVAAAFALVRQAGALLVTGLLIAALLHG